ncbi:MAG: ATP-dependent Clp protease proteolytic subunit [Chitinophagales bacterium]|nr:ATP-dependent Clp protease proteolytic subunit [Chitinophagales bacterium]
MNGEAQIFKINAVSKTKAEILLYGYIDPYDVSASSFVRDLRELEKNYKQIDVRINSGGGNVFDGFAIYNALKNSSSQIETFVDGVAASMASVIALAGKKVHMSKVARIMTHQPSTGGYGTSDELRKNAELLDAMEKTVCAVYAEKTGKTTEECKTIFLNGKDNWFTAEEALKNGLIDSIYDMEEQIVEPKNVTGERQVYDHYRELFAAKYDKTPITNMSKIVMSVTMLAALNLREDADNAAIEAAFQRTLDKAKQFDTIKAQLDAKTTELNSLKESANKEKVASMLQAALQEKKISVEMKGVLEKQYAGKPEELEELLGGMKAFASITSHIKTEHGNMSNKEMSAEYEKLDKEGSLPELKSKDLERFKQLYKARFGVEYKA